MLLIGGPADGKRIDKPSEPYLKIAINPNPPAFTPDIAVMQQDEVRMVYATYIVERIYFSESNDYIEYGIFVPDNDSRSHSTRAREAIEQLFVQYPDKTNIRHDYITNAQGKLFDNDDRDPRSRQYPI